MNNHTTDPTSLERVNPVSSTAKMCLYQLAIIGDEDAKLLSEKLNLTLDNTQNSATTSSSNANLTAAPTMMECRFVTMGEMARRAGCKTIVDLPCGYTPRAIQIAKKGFDYLGCDLPSVVEELEPVIRPLIEDNSRVRFAGVDATNYESLERALEGVEGPICINTEGLLMYFTDSEVDILCENIRRLLEKHGGCWITADPESALQYILNFQVFFGLDALQEMAKTRRNVEAKSDVAVGTSGLIIHPGKEAPETIKKAFTILASHGLKAERLPVADYMPTLISIDEEMNGKMRHAMANCAYWKMTPISTRQEEAHRQEPGQDFAVETQLSGGSLHISLRGRMDTLTAPQVLTAFESLGQEVTGVTVDCGELEYISSAGLRVLLIMQKNTSDGVTLTHVNRMCMDILSQSGFDQLLRVN